MQSQPELRTQQQQQAPTAQQQRKGKGMRRSASAPALTLRRLKQAGWTAEELITATGGAYNTHLRHFLQQHREQQLAAIRKQQGVEDGDGGGDSGEEMDLTPDDAVRGVAGTAPSWGRGGGNDSGDEMELSDSEGKRQRGNAAGLSGSFTGQMSLQQQQVPPPPPPPPGAMLGGMPGMQQYGAPPPPGGAPPPPPPALSLAPGANQGGMQPAQQQQRGRQQGGGGRGGRGAAQGRAGGRGGAQGRGGGRGSAREEVEIEEVPFFLKRAPAHRYGIGEPFPCRRGVSLCPTCEPCC